MRPGVFPVVCLQVLVTMPKTKSNQTTGNAWVRRPVPAARHQPQALSSAAIPTYRKMPGAPQVVSLQMPGLSVESVTPSFRAIGGGGGGAGGELQVVLARSVGSGCQFSNC